MGEKLTFKEDPEAAKQLTFTETVKHAAPKSMSADDQALGLETGPQTKSAGNFVAGYPGGVRQENTGPESKRLAAADYADRAREFGGEVAGQVIGSAIVPVGEGIGAPIGRKIMSAAPAAAGKVMSAAENAAPKTFEMIKKAIAHSHEEGGKLALARAVGSDAVGLAGAAGGKALAGARAIAPVAATATGGGVGAMDFTASPDLPASPALTPEGAQPGHQSSLHNAVDRLRAQAGNNPRAADLLARMAASKNTPTGTVTQSTGVA